jgi:hypothetical protein
MPGRIDCAACPFRDDPEVRCVALERGVPSLCSGVDPAGRNVRGMAEAVRRMTLEPLGRYAPPVYRNPTPSYLPAVPGAGVGGGYPGAGVPWVGPPLARQLVVSRFKENLNWLADVPTEFDVLVYNAGPPLNEYDGWPPRRGDGPPGAGAAEVVKGDYGREAGTYAKHIEDRYDNLALLTIFCQADPFPHCPDFLARIRAPWDRPTSLTDRYSRCWPPHYMRAKDHAEVHHGFPVRYGHIDGLHVDRGQWGRVFDAPMPARWVFGYAATWAVPWWAIRARPRPFWRWLHREIEAVPKDVDICSPYLHAWTLESMWSYIFSDVRAYPHRPECQA